jgi:hypothetical protein
MQMDTQICEDTFKHLLNIPFIRSLIDENNDNKRKIDRLETKVKIRNKKIKILTDLLCTIYISNSVDDTPENDTVQHIDSDLDDAYLFIHDEYIQKRKGLDIKPSELFREYGNYCQIHKTKQNHKKGQFMSKLEQVEISTRKTNGNNYYKRTLNELQQICEKFKWIKTELTDETELIHDVQETEVIKDVQETELIQDEQETELIQDVQEIEEFDHYEEDAEIDYDDDEGDEFIGENLIHKAFG